MQVDAGEETMKVILRIADAAVGGKIGLVWGGFY